MTESKKGLIAALKASEARLAHAERLALLGSWVWDESTETFTWSEEMSRILGIDPEDGPTDVDRFRGTVHPDDLEATEAAIFRAIETGEPVDYECRIIRPDGEIRVLQSRAEATPIGEFRRITGYGQDITRRRYAEDRRREARDRLARHQAVLRRIARNEPLADTLAGLCLEIEELYPDARCSVHLVDADRRFLHLAAAPSFPDTAARMLARLAIADGSDGSGGAAACGTAAFRKEAVVVHDTLDDPMTAAFADLAEEHELRSVWTQPLLDPAGAVLGTFAVYRASPHSPVRAEIEAVQGASDLAALAIERAAGEQALLAAANVDPLTGLPNRNHFLDRLTERIGASGKLAVMFLDLDRFKWINDSLGHPTGDRILVQVAERLRGVLRGGDVLARFGGDEFTILVHDADAAAVELVALRVEKVFAEPFALDGGEFFLSASIGTAIADTPAEATALVRDADAAMYAAKDGGRARHAVFDDGLRERAVNRVALEAEVRRGIERREFSLYYQPIRDVCSDEWSGVEALARWLHPTRGLVAPDEFIPLAEETGLIIPLGLQLIDRAVAQIAQWMCAGHKTSVAVNLSAVQLADPAFPDETCEALRRHGVPAELLAVEITKTRVMERLDVTRVALDRLSELGVRVLIDDFGTGYSSIARLRELPVVGVKVDRAFTRDLGKDPSAPPVLAAITDLAHSLGLHVVAEGIETAAARASATTLGCDFLQGYELARPAPAEETTRLLA